MPRKAVLASIALAIAACLTLACSEAPMPGVEYSFSNEVLSAADTRSFGGKVAVAGDYAAVELPEGDGLVWHEHVVLITNDGGATYNVVLPERKSYYEAAEGETGELMRKAIRAALARLNLRISNIDSSFEDEGRDERLLDYPTRRFRHELTYDVTLTHEGRNIAAENRVITRIWTTDMLPQRYATFLRQQQGKTGLDSLDAVIARDLEQLEGFPLKQVVRTVVTVDGMPQTSTATFEVDDFRETTIPVDRFEVPAGFDEIDPPAPDVRRLLRTP